MQKDKHAALAELPAAFDAVMNPGGSSKLNALVWSEALYDAALKHCKYMESTNTFSHANFSTRLNGFGRASGTGENIAAGRDTAENTIWRYLIDRNTPSRGHRKSILNHIYTHSATAACGHRSWGKASVTLFARNFVPNY